LLSQQLKAGRKPDIAIFYDGINESLVGGFSPGIPTAHWNFEMIKTRVENGAGNKLGLLNNSHSFQLDQVVAGKLWSKGASELFGQRADNQSTGYPPEL
jgi:hypothetical protein